MAVIFQVTAIDLFERPVRLRIPFRFGDATVTEAPQAFVRAQIRINGSSDSEEISGAAAELMIPKWFDKSTQKSNEENIDDLRRALTLAADAYVSESAPSTAFGHFARHYQPLIRQGSSWGLNALTVNYGPALIDRAILDALCRALRISFATAVRMNISGIDARLTSDLSDAAIGGFLSTLQPASRIAARHTVGMLDPLTTADVVRPAHDMLPQTLEEIISVYGNRYFKLKLCGEPATDLARLLAVAGVLDRLPSYAVTLDGNEQFPDIAIVAEFWQRVMETPALRRLAAATLYLEQPLPRDAALETDIGPSRSLPSAPPMLIDESDATLEAFPTARRRGYTGVSSKGCKGIYKSLLNAARCVSWNGRDAQPYFISAEDLTTQAGLAVQQDLALAGILGLQHVERNGHHYVDGFAGQGAAADEQQRFLAKYPSLYSFVDGSVRLKIRDGTIDLSSLETADFASAAQPDWESLCKLENTKRSPPHPAARLSTQPIAEAKP